MVMGKDKGQFSSGGMQSSSFYNVGCKLLYLYFWTSEPTFTHPCQNYEYLSTWFENVFNNFF